MSKGQPRVTVRVPEPLYRALYIRCAELTARPDHPPVSITDFILEAILEKLHHAGRGRGLTVRRPTTERPDPGDKRRVNGRLLASEIERMTDEQYRAWIALGPYEKGGDDDDLVAVDS